MLALLLSFLMDAMRVQTLGNQRHSDGADADEAPFPFRVLHQLSYDKRRQDSRRAHPMADFTRRRMMRVLACPFDLCRLNLMLHVRVNVTKRISLGQALKRWCFTIRQVPACTVP
jgi:hypothetical protein